MKQRFILFRRNRTFYCEDTETRRQLSLRTRDEAEARTLLAATPSASEADSEKPPDLYRRPKNAKQNGLHSWLR